MHVGHSYGSAQTFAYASLYPDESDGIVLTGFSTNRSFIYFPVGADWQQAALNDPARFAEYPRGYLVNSNIESMQYLFLDYPNFDPEILDYAEATKQTVTVGELLTRSASITNSSFGGP